MVLRAAGLEINLVDSPFPQPLGKRTLGDVWSRQIRWGAHAAQGRSRCIFFPELLSGSATPAIIGAYAAGLFGVTPLAGAALVLAILYSGETALALSNRWQFLLAPCRSSSCCAI